MRELDNTLFKYIAMHQTCLDRLNMEHAGLPLYQPAIQYHLKHLNLLQELKERRREDRGENPESGVVSPPDKV
jgi:hypothetical protein